MKKSLLVLPVVLLFSLLFHVEVSAQYCITGLYSTGCGEYGDRIDLFQLNTINNPSSNCPPNSFSDFTSISTQLSPGQTYQVSIGAGSATDVNLWFGVWIDFDNNGNFSGANEFVYASQNPTTSPFEIVTGSITIPPGIVSGQKRLRVRTKYNSPALTASQSCTSFTWGETEDYTVNIGQPAPNDAGITEIVSPAGVFCPNTTLPVTARLKNFGNNVLSSVTVNWTVGGSPQAPVIFTGSLDTTGGVNTGDTVLALGSYLFGSTPAEIIAWTSLPNGQADTVNNNDTATRVLQPALSGTFTVGGTGADYPNLAAAAAAISTGGVCGPVVLNIDSASGPYTGQVSFTGITGASATNTITVNGNGAVIQHAGITADIAIVKLSGANYVKLDRLNIRSTGVTTTTGILFTNNSNYNTIENCVIDMSASTTLAATVVGIAFTGSITATTTAGSTGSFDTIRNNRIIGSATGGAYYGITLTGTAGTGCTGNVIENNLIEDFYAYGVYALNATNNLVSRNEMSKPNRTAQTTFAGVFLSTACAGNIVERNRIHNPCGGAPLSTSALYPIYLSGADAPIGNENRIYNNLIYNITGNGTVYGIYNTTSDGMHAYYNTISLDNTAATGGITRGFYQLTLATNIEFRNNIISITRGGSGVKHGIYLGANNSSVLSNNNVIYLGSAGTGAQHVGYFNSDQTSLAAWQLANGGIYDQNSAATNPQFQNVATNNLVPTSGTANNIGLPVVGITTDFDGVIRNATNPDPGVYEFSPVGTDLAFVSATVPSSGCDLTANETAVVRFQNAGANPATGFTVSYILNSGTPVAQTYSGNLASGGIDTMVFTAINLSAAQAHTLQFFVSLTGDGNLFNDSSSVYTSTSTASQPSPSIPNPNVTVCSGSSAFLSATGTGTVAWYSDAGLTQQVGVGNNVLSGPVTGNTTFYASNDIGFTESAARNTYVGTANTTGNAWGLVFNVVNTPVRIQSVDVYAVAAAGTISVELTNSIGTVLQTAGPFPYPAGGSITSPLTMTLPVNFDVPVGTGYRMLSVSHTGGALIRETTGITYPFTSNSGNVVVTSGYIAGTTLATYYWFYNWQVSTGTGCPGVSPVNVTVSPVPPAPDFDVDITNNVVQFTNKTNSGSTYSWDFGDATTSTAVNPVKTYSATGVYFVTLTASNACVSNSQSAPQIVEIQTMGIDTEATSSESIQIYPNPSDGLFTIRFGEEFRDAELILTNMQGKEVRRLKQEMLQTMELNLTQYPSGIYLLRISNTGTDTHLKKLIIE